MTKNRLWGAESVFIDVEFKYLIRQISQVIALLAFFLSSESWQ